MAHRELPGQPGKCPFPELGEKKGERDLWQALATALPALWRQQGAQSLPSSPPCPALVLFGQCGQGTAQGSVLGVLHLLPTLLTLPTQPRAQPSTAGLGICSPRIRNDSPV